MTTDELFIGYWCSSSERGTPSFTFYRTWRCDNVVVCLLLLSICIRLALRVFTFSEVLFSWFMKTNLSVPCSSILRGASLIDLAKVDDELKLTPVSSKSSCIHVTNGSWSWESLSTVPSEAMIILLVKVVYTLIIHSITINPYIRRRSTTTSHEEKMVTAFFIIASNFPNFASLRSLKSTILTMLKLGLEFYSAGVVLRFLNTPQSRPLWVMFCRSSHGHLRGMMNEHPFLWYRYADSARVISSQALQGWPIREYGSWAVGGRTGESIQWVLWVRGSMFILCYHHFIFMMNSKLMLGAAACHRLLATSVISKAFSMQSNVHSVPTISISFFGNIASSLKHRAPWLSPHNMRIK